MSNYNIKKALRDLLGKKNRLPEKEAECDHWWSAGVGGGYLCMRCGVKAHESAEEKPFMTATYGMAKEQQLTKTSMQSNWKEEFRKCFDYNAETSIEEDLTKGEAFIESLLEHVIDDVRLYAKDYSNRELDKRKNAFDELCDLNHQLRQRYLGKENNV